MQYCWIVAMREEFCTHHTRTNKSLYVCKANTHLVALKTGSHRIIFFGKKLNTYTILGTKKYFCVKKKKRERGYS